MVSQCAGWKTWVRLVEIKLSSESVFAVGQIARAAEKPKPFTSKHFKENTVGVVVEKAAVVNDTRLVEAR